MEAVEAVDLQVVAVAIQRDNAVVVIMHITHALVFRQQMVAPEEKVLMVQEKTVKNVNL